MVGAARDVPGGELRGGHGAKPSANRREAGRCREALAVGTGTLPTHCSLVRARHLRPAYSGALPCAVRRAATEAAGVNLPGTLSGRCPVHWPWATSAGGAAAALGRTRARVRRK